MKSEPKTYKIEDLVSLYEQEMLSVDPEYQRGPVWETWQKKQFVDSVMRGYPVPVLYFHHIHKKVGKFSKDILSIIDGQQRIRALYDFYKGEWKLFDPNKENSEARFPNFVKGKPCPWGDKSFEDFSESLKKKFLEKELGVVEIKSSNENEVRDLFIRLQAGSPLNDQEVRDAWPGKFTEFILKLGGKPEITGCPGHEFFQSVMKMNPRRDRGATRQVAAWIAMEYLEFMEKRFCALKSKEINTFYHKHIDFDVENSDVKRLIQILDLLTDLFSDGQRPKMKGHESIHLVLFVSSLMSDYPPGWRKKLPDAFDEFRRRCAVAKKASKNDEESEFTNYLNRYVHLTASGSNNIENIELRHRFFIEEMIKLLDIEKKDVQRSFSQAEKEIIYYRDNKKCQVCIKKRQDADVRWDEADIHHVVPHSKGGITAMDNAALVHRNCHPKGISQEEDFRQWWQESRLQTRRTVPVVETGVVNALKEKDGSYEIENPSDVTFSRVQSASVNGSILRSPNWNRVVLAMVEVAVCQKGLTVQHLMQRDDSGVLTISQGRDGRHNWPYNENGDFSIIEKSANGCLESIKSLAQISGIDFYIVFRYNKGANNGKVGRWIG